MFPSFRTLFVSAILCGGASTLFAQSTSSIAGRVLDESGAAVPAAQVAVINTGTNLRREVACGEAGDYKADFLPVGNYHVEVTSAGFKKFVQTGVVLTVNVPVRVDVTMTLGAVAESITVEGGVPLVETSNAQVGRSVSNAEIAQLPIVGRNIYTLLTLTPGVTSSANSSTLGFPEQRTMINGGVDAAIGSVNYFLDGGANMTGLRNTGNVAPNPDAVQEFRVITNSYSAEFGRFAGGVVNILTKSGTNQIHGSMFEFFRNAKLNAANWGFAAPAPLQRHQFGATVGGPIRKDRTFFFVSYGGLRQLLSQSFNAAVVPTALERTGDFLQSRVAPTDPLTRQPFPEGRIPATRFDPTARNILDKFIPLSNTSNGVYQANIPNPFNSNEILLKGDHNITNRHMLTLSYFLTPGTTTSQTSGNLPWSLQQLNWRQHNANLSETFAVSPTTVNQFWMTFTRNFGGRLNLPQTSLGDLGSRFVIQGPKQLPQIAVTGFFTLGQNISGPVAGSNFYSVRDSVSHTRGRHTLKFGGELSLGKTIQQTLLNNYGVFNFTGTRAANALADFQLGLPVTMNQDSPVDAYNNFWTSGLFLQDDFRVNKRLTLNLGLRYELQTAPTDPQNRIAVFVPGRQSTVIPTAPLGLLVAGDPGVPRGGVATPKRHFSPRFGFAFDPFGDGKTSIRGAAGLFWGSISGNLWNQASNFQPFAVRQQFNAVGSLTDPYSLLPGGVSPFPYVYDPAKPRFIAPSQLLGIAPDFRWSHNYQFNFALQRQVTKDFAMTAGYVGTMYRHLTFGVDLNYPVFSSTATTANVNARRPLLPGILAAVGSLQSGMTSNYHSLQVTADKRFRNHFSVKSFYTLAKGLSGAVMEGGTSNALVQDFRNMALDYARLDNDRKHNFVTSVLYETQYFQDRALHALLDGWEVSAIITLQSGMPFTVTTGTDVNLDGNNNDRPNLVADPRLDPNRSRAAVTAAWFNTAAFIRGANGTTGTAGRNILDGPGLPTSTLASSGSSVCARS
ncbi:MAG: TonB-dependent receptor domain-containing protein [Bryobacteraceae bacterium]